MWLLAAVVASSPAVAVLAQDEEAEPELNAIPVAAIQREEPVDFAREIYPLLKKNCLACHNATKAKSKLNLETPQTILKGGSEGPAVVPGKSEESLLLLVAAHRRDPPMPPANNKSNAVPFTSEELGLVKLWIDQGAKGDAAALFTTPDEWLSVDHEGEQHPIYAAGLSGDGRFAACGRGSRIFLYESLSGKLFGKLVDPELAKETVYAGNPVAHRDLVQAIAFNRYGLMASGGFRTVKFWRFQPPATGDPLPAMPQPVTVVTVSADGNRTALADSDGNIRYWSAGAHDKAVTLKPHEGPVTALAFHHARPWIFSAGSDGALRVVDCDAGKEIGYATAPASITSMVALESGNLLVSASDTEKTLRLWAVFRTETGGAALNPIKAIEGHEQPVHALAALGIEGDQFISGSDDGTLRHWHAREGKEVRSFNCEAPVTKVASAPGGKRFASIDANEATRLWDAESGNLVEQWRGSGRKQAGKETIAFETEVATKLIEKRKTKLGAAEKRYNDEQSSAAKAATAATAAEANLKRKEEAWREAAADKKKQDQVNGEINGLRQTLTKARQNAELAVRLTTRAAEQLTVAKMNLTAAESGLKEAETDTTNAAKAFDESVKVTTSLVFTSDSQYLLTAGESGEIQTRNAEGGQFLGAYRAGTAGVTALAEAPGGKLLRVANDNTLTMSPIEGAWTWERSLGAVDKPEVFSGRVTALAFSPNGRRIATGSGIASRNGELKVWNVSDGSLVFADDKTHSDTIVGIAYSPDGRYVATASTDRFMRVFNAEDGSLVKSFEGHSGHVLDVAWSADGLTLATAGADKLVKLWDFEEGKQLKSLEGYNKEVTSVQFLGSGETILSSAGDKSVRVGNDRLGETDAFMHVAGASPDGKILIAGGQDSVLRVWRAADKKILHRIAP